MKTAKLFQTGGSQAVRLPKEFRIEGSEVYIAQEGERIILSPKKKEEWPLKFFQDIRITDSRFKRPGQPDVPPVKPIWRKVFLLDTDTCIDVLRGRRNALQKLRSLSPDDCAVSSITAFELYTGALLSAHPARERVKIEQFLNQLLVIAFDRVTAQHSASLRVELQRGGSTIGAYDLLIAAEAVRSRLILVSSNEREFREAGVLARLIR
jgi:tRNA(fMet)-specific endonuclease VapC